MTATKQIKKMWANREFGPWSNSTPRILGHHEYDDGDGIPTNGDVLFRLHEGKLALHVQTPDRGDVPLAETTGWKWRQAV